VPALLWDAETTNLSAVRILFPELQWAHSKLFWGSQHAPLDSFSCIEQRNVCGSGSAVLTIFQSGRATVSRLHASQGMQNILDHHGGRHGSHCHIQYLKYHVVRLSRVGLFAMGCVCGHSWSTSQRFFGAAVKAGATGIIMTVWLDMQLICYFKYRPRRDA
jgi:hypothetical protein